jgi:phage tail sheath gpL-like
MISFNQIPSNIGVSGQYVEFDGTGARTGQGAKPVRILVIGQMASPYVAVTNPYGSTATPNIPVQVSSAAQAEKLFGKWSIITEMLRTVFKTNSFDEVQVVAQKDGAGTSATWTVDYTASFAIPATIAGLETLYIGGVQFAVATIAGDTSAIVAAAIAAKINADNSVPYTATDAAGVITITSRHTGESPNDLQIHHKYYDTDVSASGASPVITQTVVGAGNPSNLNALAIVAADYYTDIIHQYTDDANLDRLEAQLAERWLPLPSATSTGPGQNDAHAYIAKRGSEAQLVTFAADRNSQHVSCQAVEPARTLSGTNYPGLLSPHYVVAASFGAKVARECGVRPNIPLQNVQLPCIVAAPRVCQWTWNERQRLIVNQGFATYKYDSANNVTLERATTMLTQTVDGLPTDAERDTETQKTNSYFRWSLRQWIATNFPRSRLAGDEAGLGNDGIVTPALLKSSILSLALRWRDAGLLENFADFKNGLVVERSVADCNTMNVSMKPDHVNQFRVFAAKIAYRVC